MVFEISYTEKWNLADPRSRFSRSFFLEHQNAPSREAVEDLVKEISEGNFGRESIRIEEYKLFDAESLRKVRMPVYQLE